VDEDRHSQCRAQRKVVKVEPHGRIERRLPRERQQVEYSSQRRQENPPIRCKSVPAPR
jgi:hypothetical protein